MLPPGPAYGALIAALGAEVEPVAKDLEVYATSEPPEDYSLELEIPGVLREADAHGWERFHLVGYSGGGGASLAFAAARPERLASLALLEPAWAGNWDLSPAEKALWLEYDRLEGLPAERFMPAFMQFGVRPGVPLPAPAPGDPSSSATTSTRPPDRARAPCELAQGTLAARRTATALRSLAEVGVGSVPRPAELESSRTHRRGDRDFRHSSATVAGRDEHDDR